MARGADPLTSRVRVLLERPLETREGARLFGNGQSLPALVDQEFLSGVIGSLPPGNVDWIFLREVYAAFSVLERKSEYGQRKYDALRRAHIEENTRTGANMDDHDWQ
jgi:hypothetical protein